jgi:hypothetical protein
MNTQMIDLLKIPKAAVEYLAGLLDRDAQRASPFVDDLPPVPDGVRHAFLWRLSQGHIVTPAPRQTRLPIMGREDFETRFRDAE